MTKEEIVQELIKLYPTVESVKLSITNFGGNDRHVDFSITEVIKKEEVSNG